jgi:hypothetical protein
MSSPKLARTKTAPTGRAAPTPGAKQTCAESPAAKPAVLDETGSVDSAAAKRLAAALESAVAGGRHDVLHEDALHALTAAVCKCYAAQVEAGAAILPLPERGGATATEVMLMASGLLKSANLAVFDLGMWRSMTGR